MNPFRDPIVDDCVVDASVLAKLFLPEDGSVIAQALLRQVTGTRPLMRAVPSFAYVECANIFWKAVRRGTLESDRARAHFQRLLILPLTVWASEELIERALELALSLGVTVYDAIYLALAERLNVPLITADAALVRRAAGTTLNVRPLQ